MRRLILIIFFAGLLAPLGLHAQKVYKDGDKVILDMTVGAGMPAGAVTATPKYTSFSPSQAQMGADNGLNGNINAKVFHKLEIAKSDYSSGGNWATAFNGCKGWTHNDSAGWRLPTARELQMMWIFKPALGALGAAFNTVTNYWSATECAATNSWFVNFGTGNSVGNDSYTQKSNTYRVRCVREISD